MMRGTQLRQADEFRVWQRERRPFVHNVHRSQDGSGTPITIKAARPKPAYEGPLDLMPYVSQVQSNLTLVARAVGQLDKRMRLIEGAVEQEIVEPEPSGRGYGSEHQATHLSSSQATWGLVIALIAGFSLVVYLLAGLLGW